ncbi:MAG: cation transporter [Candidatus Omnitrophica bacterium]|nr:cation transporter [Candidatus Omnitrophota bacterium]
MIEKAMCPSTDLEDCRACSKKILGWTVVGNTFLAGLKIAGGVCTNSSGLLADGFQSISCVATSILIMVSLGFSQRKSDERFPYGYTKIEFIAALSAFSILIGIGLFVVLSNLLGILRREFVQPDIMALPVVMISAFLTYMMYRYNFCAGTKLDSPGMVANGCHAGADLFSSGAVIVAIILSQFGPSFAICDKLAAMIVGIIIIRDSLAHWNGNLQIILDQVPGPGFQQNIEQVIAGVNPEYHMSRMKFRRVGKKFWIGLSLRCPMTGTVQQNDVLMSRLRHAIIEAMPEISDIIFFIEAAKE